MRKTLSPRYTVTEGSSSGNDIYVTYKLKLCGLVQGISKHLHVFSIKYIFYKKTLFMIIIIRFEC